MTTNYAADRRGAGEMAQMVKYLPCKQEDPSLTPAPNAKC